MTQWLFLAGVVALVAAKPKSPKTVRLEAGRTYRLRLEIVRSDVPLTPQLLDGIKQGLELSGQRDVRVIPGARPAIEYTQTTVQTTELQIGQEIPLQIGGVSLVIKFVWAKPIANAGV